MTATKKSRDVEASYSVKDYVEKLRRFADALEKGERFQIQIAGERVYVPARAEFSIEHERGDQLVLEERCVRYPLFSGCSHLTKERLVDRLIYDTFS